jgi:hypothetical protein
MTQVGPGLALGILIGTQEPRVLAFPSESPGPCSLLYPTDKAVGKVPG